MKTYYDFKKALNLKGPVVVLGVFDGVHKGHKKIIKAAVGKARRIKGASIVLTFWPHPQQKEVIYSLEHRLKLFAELGADVCIVVSFDKKFAQMSAKGFIKKILYGYLRARYIFIGKNFRFGRQQEGDKRTLKTMSRKYGYRLKVFEVLKTNAKPISSTFIRLLIKQGKLKQAETLLGRAVSILGKVIRGSFIGHKLGFPTANIEAQHEVTPPEGVYSAEVIFDHKKFPGICYIGRKPTFRMKGVKKKKFIEVHIFNFNKNIYSKELEIQFLQKIRGEKRFSSAQSLVRQIRRDIARLDTTIYAS